MLYQLAKKYGPAALATGYGSFVAKNQMDLYDVRNNQDLELDPSTRLSAYQSTLGHQSGTVGRGANLGIGSIYSLLGTAGQDEIGNFFNSDYAQSRLDDSVNSSSNLDLGQGEYDYWQNQWQNEGTFGGFMGSSFNPQSRAFIQRNLARF